MTTPATQQKPTRMRLDAVVKGKRVQPHRLLVHGQEGVGKSTFAAGAPSPIFLGAEDGTAHLDVARFPSPERWTDVLEAVRVLSNDEHAYRTLVIDTVDWAEPMLWEHICARDNTKERPIHGIEDYGFGKGYVAALDEWRVLLASLERLRNNKGMHIILLAHSALRLFKNPEGEDFDRYELKLNTKAGGLLKEWSDAALFARFEVYAKQDAKTKRVRGVATGARLLCTERTAAYDAKNRYGLPDRLPLSWADFEAAVAAGTPADAEALRSEILRKAKELGGELEKKVVETVAKAGEDAARLVEINNRVNARLSEKAQVQ